MSSSRGEDDGNTVIANSLVGGSSTDITQKPGVDDDTSTSISRRKSSRGFDGYEYSWTESFLIACKIR